MRTSLPLALLAAAALATPARADEPPDDLPPPAIRRVLDLVFTVEDLETRVEDLRIAETDLEIRLELAADVLFAFDRAELGPDAIPVLQKAAAFLRDKASAGKGRGKIRIEGHTDSKGETGYNQKLSERRAMTVRTWLARDGGLDGVTFEVKGFGETKPAVPNEKPDGSDDEGGRKRNRRVEIVVRKG